MRFAIRLAAEKADGFTTEHAIVTIERTDGALTTDDLGLRIEDPKAILAAIQAAVIETQVRDLARRRRPCPCCGAPRRVKDHRTIRVRTPFGPSSRCRALATGGAAASPPPASPRRSSPPCPSG